MDLTCIKTLPGINYAGTYVEEIKLYKKHRFPLRYINWRLKANIINALLNTHEAVLMGLKHRT